MLTLYQYMQSRTRSLSKSTFRQQTVPIQSLPIFIGSLPNEWQSREYIITLFANFCHKRIHQVHEYSTVPFNLINMAQNSNGVYFLPGCIGPTHYTTKKCILSARGGGLSPPPPRSSACSAYDHYRKVSPNVLLGPISFKV